MKISARIFTLILSGVSVDQPAEIHTDIPSGVAQCTPQCVLPEILP